MIYGSVCSGIEAASVAWHPLGWRPSFFSEIDAFPRAVLKHHYPDVPLHGDFTTIQKGDYAAIDVLVGGTPCQSFSVAGLRGGLADDRGNLALEFLRLADRLSPRWLVWENVPGVLSSNRGRDFGAILGGMVELGYGFAYRVLDAVYFGCAAPRNRVFVVGYRGDWRPSAAVLFQRKCLEGHQAPTDTGLSVGTAPVLTRLGAMAYDDRTPCVLERWGARRATPLEWERALGFPDGWTNVPQDKYDAERKAKGQSRDALRHNAGRLRKNAQAAEGRVRSLRRFDEAPSGGSLPPDGGGERHPLPPVQHQASDGGRHGVGNARVGLSRGRRQVADGPRYKALGNSMAVPVMRWIGERIDRVERIVQAAQLDASNLTPRDRTETRASAGGRGDAMYSVIP